MKTVEVKKDGVYLDGEKFFLVSGDFHYFRTLPDGWKRRLELMKDFGLTAVTTYVAWNLHEPKRGEYYFEGLGDIERYLKEADEVGLKVILRFSPYMCAEWEMGGLPSWLLSDRKIALRTCDPLYFEPAKSFIKVLVEKIRPYLYTNGGPIILLGLENEYGSFGDDVEYLKKLNELYKECKMDVPFMSANGADSYMYDVGSLPEHWNTIDIPPKTDVLEKKIEFLRMKQPDKPLMVGEAWVGNIQFWGKSFGINRGVQEQADFFKRALEMGVVVNFYMFCGGTNFAFYNGALCSNAQKQYIPLMTSYDYDAPISEDGVPREKYFAMRDVLDEYLGKEPRPHIVPKHLTQKIEGVKFTECAPLFSNLDTLAEKKVKAYRTLCMEDLDQDYGFILYRASIPHTDFYKRRLCIEGLADRATVYINGKYLGSYMRDTDNENLEFVVPEGGATLDILVENLGRVGFSYFIYGLKGITNCIHFEIYGNDGEELWDFAPHAAPMNYEIITLPMKDISGVSYTGEMLDNGQPAFFRGTFKAQEGIDAFLDTKGFGKGFVFINGFNIGRFWNIGPQRTLYVPGEILKEENVIELFELHTENKPDKVNFLDYAILTEIEKEDHSLDDFILGQV